MQELEKILKDIEQAKGESWYRMNDHVTKSRIDGAIERITDIIRKHMNDANGTFAFDFSSTDSFDCPCGRHYVHVKMPPKLVFCPECEEKVRNNRTDICPECRKKLYEYEKKYNCIVDIGIIGAPGEPGGRAEQEEV